MSGSTVEQRIRASAVAVKRAESLLEALLVERERLMTEARLEGATYLQVAEWAGVTRQRVHQVTQRAQNRRSA